MEGPGLFPAYPHLTPSFLGILGELQANIPAPKSNPLHSLRNYPMPDRAGCRENSDQRQGYRTVGFSQTPRLREKRAFPSNYVGNSEPAPEAKHLE